MYGEPEAVAIKSQTSGKRIFIVVPDKDNIYVISPIYMCNFSASSFKHVKLFWIRELLILIN